VSRYGYLPYGVGPMPGTDHYLYTGKERDQESNLDFFGARFYASNMGRFMSPDWSSVPQAVPFATLSNPQTLNLYSYAGNNPFGNIDGDGHNWFTDLLNGAFNAVYNPFAMVLQHPAVTGTAIGNAVVHPIATVQSIRNSVVTTSQQVMTGNGYAIGTAIGTVGILAVPGLGEVGDTAEAVEGVAEAGEATEAGANYAGDNIVQGAGRINSDLPGGQQAASDKFNDLTKGQGTSVDPKTGHTVADDGTRLRNIANGTARIDRPASVTGGQHETIHYNNPD
jgi:RHS repeat-associated protein